MRQREKEERLDGGCHRRVTLWPCEIDRIEISCSYSRLHEGFAVGRHSSEEVIRSLTVMEVAEVGYDLDYSGRNFYLQNWFAVSQKSVDVDRFAIDAPDRVGSACGGQALPVAVLNVVKHDDLLV